MKLATLCLIIFAISLSNAGNLTSTPPSVVPICYNEVSDTVEIILTYAEDLTLMGFHHEMMYSHFEPGTLLKRMKASRPFPACNINATLLQVKYTSLMMPLIIIAAMIVTVVVCLMIFICTIICRREERMRKCLEKATENMKQSEPAGEPLFEGFVNKDFPALDRKPSLQWERKLVSYFKASSIDNLPAPCESDLNLDNIIE